MKVAVMVRGYLPVPRLADMVYAPIDLAVQISRGLVGKGHEVTFFAPEGSSLDKISVQTAGLRPLAGDNDSFQALLRNLELQVHFVPGLWDMKLSKAMFEQAEAGTFDMLYFHHPEVFFPFASDYPKVPIACNLHDPISDWLIETQQLYNSPNQHFISISDNQRKPAPDLNWLATIHHGVDTDEFPFSEQAGDYLMYAGRIVPEKGVKEAVEIARKANEKLLIAGPIYPTTQKYFNRHIKPYLNDKIKYIGYVERHNLHQYYKKAKAFLAPLKWEEPFGLTIIEAMACGTPVVALRRGSIPEIVAHGKTGFIVDSVNEMVLALKDIGSIKRQDCRQHICDNFTISHMVDNYEKAFKKLLATYRTG